jgi:hypothetical protein
MIRTDQYPTREATPMPALAAPLPAENLADWEAWIGELTGSRKDEFEDMNARHGLTEHRAYLQPLPDGSFLVLAIHEGPGADGFLAGVMGSDNPFDQEFIASVGRLHGMDASGPMPPMAQRRL